MCAVARLTRGLGLGCQRLLQRVGGAGLSWRQLDAAPGGELAGEAVGIHNVNLPARMGWDRWVASAYELAGAGWGRGAGGLALLSEAPALAGGLVSQEIDAPRTPPTSTRQLPPAPTCHRP